MSCILGCMYRKLLTPLFILSLLVSCGKKAEENDKSFSDKLTHSEAETVFLTLHEINRCVEANDIKSLSLILNEKTNLSLNGLGNDGETLLTKALSNGFSEIALLLINAGADINVSNINNESPLVVASNKNLNSLAQELVERGAEINKKDVFGDTPLLLSIKRKNETLAIFLIEKGANIMINDRYGRSPYYLAGINKLPAVREVLKKILQQKFGEPTKEQFRAQILDNEFKWIVRSLNRFSHLVLLYEDLNPLALLAHRDNEEEMIEGAKLFMRWGAKINGPINSQSNPPLIEAMLNHRYRYVLFLLDSKADPNKVLDAKLTPLYYAIELNEPELVEKLLSKGAFTKTLHFDACKFTKKISDELTSTTDKQKNKEIKRMLFCGFRSWL